MKLKGIEKFREKLPNYSGNRILLLPLRALTVTILGYLFLIGLDVLPRLCDDILLLTAIEPLLPIVGSLVIAILIFHLIGLMWNKKDRMMQEYGELAYQKMIPYGVSGVALIPALIIHGATSIRSLPPSPPINSLTILWSQSILSLIGVPSEIDILIRVILSSIFLILGLLTMRAALLTFGIDYMAVLYLYFPDESEIQDNEIYSIIRHPVYLAIVMLGIAAFLFRLSFYSFLLCCILYFVVRLHIQREEKELLQRFGNSYKEYMNRTSTLWIKPSKFSGYLRFLRGPKT